MKKPYTKTASSLIALANAARFDYAVHPADNTKKNSAYAKNYSKQKPHQVKQAGRTLAD